MRDFIHRKIQVRVIWAFLLSFILLFITAGIFWNSNKTISPPSFSNKSGFYEMPFYVTIEAPSDVSVFYTIDGTDPTSSSHRYSSPIYLNNATSQANRDSMRTDTSTGFYTELIKEFAPYCTDPCYMPPDFLIDKCHVLKAIAINKKGEQSIIASATYFIGLPVEHYNGCNILSLSTDPDNLFNNRRGIYVTGGLFDWFLSRLENEPSYALQIKNDFNFSQWSVWPGNYNYSGADWERIGEATLFDSSGIFVRQQAVGIRIQGHASRGYLPKSLRLYAYDSQHQKDTFQKGVFGNSYTPHAIILFSGGQDYITHFKDYAVATQTRSLTFASMHFEPYVLFLNGEYWGFYFCTEKYDPDYLSYYYNINPHEIVMIKNNELSFGKSKYEQLYTTMRQDLIKRNMADSTQYQYALTQIDINSYLDYYACLAYIARCGDWPYINTALWRTISKTNRPYHDGKWRWMLFDVNSQAMTEDLIEFDSIDYLCQEDEMFASLWQNTVFRAEFKARVLQIADQCFDPDAMDALIDEYTTSTLPALSQSWQRFYGSQNEILTQFNQKMSSYRIFFHHRKKAIEKILQNK